MRTSTSGLLLLLIGVTILSGFLTGNLDRWLTYLFDPSRPPLVDPTGSGMQQGTIQKAAGERRSSTGASG